MLEVVEEFVDAVQFCLQERISKRIVKHMDLVLVPRTVGNTVNHRHCCLREQFSSNKCARTVDTPVPQVDGLFEVAKAVSPAEMSERRNEQAADAAPLVGMPVEAVKSCHSGTNVRVPVSQ